MKSGDLILMARRRAGLTQRELAERIECRQATIARWERGDRQASYEDLQCVAEVCGLQLDAHLAREDRSWWPQIAVQLDCEPLQRVRRLTPPGAFDAVPVLEALADTAVSAIVLGEVAGALHGWPLVLGTGAVEVCASAADALSVALDRLGADKGVGGAYELPAGGRLLVTVLPPGTAGFGDLARDAGTVEIGGGGVRVAGLRDLLRIADASPNPDSRRQALAYQAVLAVQRARRETGPEEKVSDEERIRGMAEPADTGGVDPDREALLGVLMRHRVAFVLIGGAAIQSHGRRYDTQDVDLTPDTEPENAVCQPAGGGGSCEAIAVESVKTG